jgi:hypothetical protein
MESGTMPIKVERSEEGAHSSRVDLLATDVTTIRELIDRMAESRPEASFLISPETGQGLTFLELREQSEFIVTPRWFLLATNTRR